MLADKIGPFNALVPMCMIMTALIFAMFGVASPASTVVFAILYGISSGACTSLSTCPLVAYCLTSATFLAVLSLLGPLAASFARHPSEVGVRMGIAYSLTAIGSLTGTPITGALLTSEFHWYRAIIFSGVRSFRQFMRQDTRNSPRATHTAQLVCVAGTAFLAVARALMVRRKGTQLV